MSQKTLSTRILKAYCKVSQLPYTDKECHLQCHLINDNERYTVEMEIGACAVESILDGVGVVALPTDMSGVSAR